MTEHTFEEKLENSKKILNQLLNPAVTLEESLKLYESGIQEIKSAQSMIEKAKIKIQIIEKNNNQ